MTPAMHPPGIAGYWVQEQRQPAADGTPLFQRDYIPHGPKPTGRLDLVHGWADHGGRYAPLLSALRPLNLEICLPELRGHGHSGGQRGHVRRWEDYLSDLAQMFGLTESAGQDSGPRWLLGHSMGGLLAYHLALRYPDRYQGLILSSPFMAPPPTIGSFKRRLMRFLAVMLPSLPLRRAVDPQAISHDPDTVTAYREDPLVHGSFTPRWLTEMLKAQHQALCQAATLDTPLLLQISPDDTVVDAQASLAIYLRLPAGAKTLRVYPRRGHELFNETPAKRAKPLKDIVTWIGERQEAYLVRSAPSGGGRQV